MLTRLALVLLVLLVLAASGTDAASPVPQGAERGMIVSAHRLASQIGVAVMRQGGNAVGREPHGRYRLYGAIDPRLPVGSVAGY